MSSSLSRRTFLRDGAVALVSSFSAPRLAASFLEESGRLTTRFKKPTAASSSGDFVLADDDGRKAILHIPKSYDPKKPGGFMLALHGASGNGESMLLNQRAPADAQNVIVLSPSSRDGTWDAIRGHFSHDTAKIDQLLAQVFDRCAIDPARVAIGGFSDGATYALSLGLINGDLFTHIIAHSPGFVVKGPRHGKPKVFVSHGYQDRILPFAQCGARIVEQLTRDGYTPRFDEFNGGHTATPEMRTAALAWLNGA
jgi:phospholipase/carboxylesterase